MADQFEEQEIIDRIRDWWRENGIPLVGALVLAVGGWSGWNWYSSHVDQTAGQAFADFSEYVALRKEGEKDSERALELLGLLDDAHQGTSPQMLSFFYRAADALEAEDSSQAVDLLARIIEESPGGQVENLARLRLARLYLEQDDAQMALDMLDPVSGPGLVAMREELRGDAYRARGDLELARAAYEGALRSGQELGATDQWPFLEMKIFGLVFESAERVESGAAGSSQPASADEASTAPPNAEDEMQESIPAEVEDS